MKVTVLAIALCASPVFAGSVPQELAGADVLFLGESHDNPAHHDRQGAITAGVAPAALVFEMLTEAQAQTVTPGLMTDAAALEAALGWADSGWPDFALYYPIFAAAPGARIYGAAVPRDAARAAMTDGVAAWFGAEDAARFGLDRPLPEDQQAAREAMQASAHCDALPPEMLPVMVQIQRLRDASLARAADRALAETVGPVVVITGNGHARTDWGAPAYLALARPDAVLRSYGQSEDGAIGGSFDLQADSPGVDRDDPCAAFTAGE
ncbi:MAG: hypothetical protein CML66_01385 [Rhodobacteraceae bacterium]|nr:hypothetical protein [Paracoccaceae bacterium]MAY46397.1 hypothetical protein [Paracoccaceae bacterium]